MSRFSDYDGEEGFPNQWEFWQANYERALRGRRGRKVLAELRDALMALPERKLIEGALCTVGARAEAEAEDAKARAEPDRRPNLHRWRAADLREAIDSQGEGVCAIGAYLWHRQVRAGMTPEDAFASLPRLVGEDADPVETALAARRAGVAMVLAWELARMNDETLARKTPEQRHAAFVDWIDQQLAGSGADA